MQNIRGKAVRPIDSEAYELLRSIQAYEYKFNNANLLLLDVLFVDYGTLKDQSVWEDA